MRIEGTKARGTKRTGGLPGSTVWLIVRDGGGPLEPLCLDGEGEGALAVFGHEEEAEMFLGFRAQGDGWRSREAGPGEVVSVLYGPCRGVGSVALDPLPEMAAGRTVGLVSMSRARFVGLSSAAGEGPSREENATGIPPARGVGGNGVPGTGSPVGRFGDAGGRASSAFGAPEGARSSAGGQARGYVVRDLRRAGSLGKLPRRPKRHLRPGRHLRGACSLLLTRGRACVSRTRQGGRHGRAPCPFPVAPCSTDERTWAEGRGLDAAPERIADRSRAISPLLSGGALGRCVRDLPRAIYARRSGIMKPSAFLHREVGLSGWSRVALRAGRALEKRFDRLKLGVRRRYGWVAPPEVVTYRGHGTSEALFLKGRVLEAKGLTRSSAQDTARTNLRNMARRFLSAEVPFARLRATYAGQEVSVVADEEGFFDVRFRPAEPPDAGVAWHPVEVELLADGGVGARATGKVLVPEGARFGVISDLDDTVIQTSVTSFLKMLRTALLNNAHTRLPFEGVTRFYRALQSDVNPIFYVSSSPWNLYDLLEDFLDVHGVPAGPLFLRDWSPTALRGNEQHKLGVIRTLLATYPRLPFVLIGDSGEQDPEIYRTVVREHPGRIAAVYIRDVATRGRDAVVHSIARQVRSLGVEMLLVSSTAEAAEHAARRGLISADALPDIRHASG